MLAYATFVHFMPITINKETNVYQVSTVIFLLVAAFKINTYTAKRVYKKKKELPKSMATITG